MGLEIRRKNKVAGHQNLQNAHLQRNLKQEEVEIQRVPAEVVLKAENKV
jgi:hypothetical protein